MKRRSGTEDASSLRLAGVSMIQMQFGEESARVVALQILLNRSAAIHPKLVTDGVFGARTADAIQVFRDEVLHQSGPPRIADPGLWRSLLTRAGLEVVDSIDVTDPALSAWTEPEVSKWTSPILIGGMSNGIAQLVSDVRARITGSQSLLMLRLHGHGAPGLVAVSHGSRRVSPGVDPIGAQSVLTQQVLPVVLPLLRQLGPLFCNFGFVELHACRVARGSSGVAFVRSLAEILGVPVRAGASRQSSDTAFSLLDPTFTAFPTNESLLGWGFSRREAVRVAVLAS